MIFAAVPGLMEGGRSPTGMRPGIGITRRQAIHLNSAALCPNKSGQILERNVMQNNYNGN